MDSRLTWYVHWYCGDLVSKLRQLLTAYLLATHGHFRFWIITWVDLNIKLDVCIDIMEIKFRIAIGYLSLIFERPISPWHDNGGVLSFHVFIVQENSFTFLRFIWTSDVSQQHRENFRKKYEQEELVENLPICLQVFPHNLHYLLWE